MISVLLPTRSRPYLYRLSVRTLMETISDTTNMEVLTAVDPDDVDFYADIPDKLVVEERYGYSQLHRYYNALAERATGEWLLLWNDDAMMDSTGWDVLLNNLPESTLVADFQSQHSPGLCCFPAVRKRAVEAVGGFSLHTPHCDTYWQDIGRATGSIQAVDAYVDHRRYDVSGDNNDVTYQESQGGYKTHEYYGPIVQSLIAQDIETIRGIL